MGNPTVTTYVEGLDAYGRQSSFNPLVMRSLVDTNLANYALNSSTSFQNVENGYVNFYTNWNDAENLPKVYGSGICIPMLDSAYKLHLYGTLYDGELWFGITYNHGWHKLRKVITGNQFGYLDNWLTFAGANTRIIGSAGSLYLAANSTVTCVNYDNTVLTPISASAFNVSSSRIIKENVVDTTDDDAMKILNLRVVNFDYINGDKSQCGLIAEEVADIIPHCVRIPDKYSEELAKKQLAKGELPDVPSIDYSKLVAPLIKLVQMQQKQIELLTHKVDKLINFLNCA